MDDRNKEYLSLLFKRAKWHTCYECEIGNTCLCLQGTTVKYAEVMSGYTIQAGVAVIANQLEVVANTLLNARRILFMQEKESQCQFTINGLLVSAFLGLQSVMDCIATFCQHHEPDDACSDDKVYFDGYSFISSKVSFIRNERSNMKLLRFKDHDYSYWANTVKHNCTWFGLVTVSERSGLADIYDDNQHGLYMDMIIPLFNHVCAIMERLGSIYKLPVRITKV